MQDIQDRIRSGQRTISPWMILSFTVFMMLIVNAVIILGLVQMSSALQIAVTAATMILIALGALFSVIELSGISQTASLDQLR